MGAKKLSFLEEYQEKIKSGDIRGAYETIKKAEASSPTPDELLLIGSIYLQMGLNQDAERALTRADEEGVKNYALYVNLGVCYNRLGRFDEAVETLYKALEMRDDIIGIYINLTTALKYAGKTQEALDLLD
ncbi:MAG TPA: tetratricopeptide repeat protein, partial [Firmicutes bacterium]|nr:tetratricopeptide repeat protein [Bacillota bacterium]